MTNEELDKAIDTAARHSSYRFNDGDLCKLMRDHLQQLLAIQLERAKLGADKMGERCDEKN